MRQMILDSRHLRVEGTLAGAYVRSVDGSTPSQRPKCHLRGFWRGLLDISHWDGLCSPIPAGHRKKVFSNILPDFVEVRRSFVNGGLDRHLRHLMNGEIMSKHKDLMRLALGHDAHVSARAPRTLPKWRMEGAQQQIARFRTPVKAAVTAA